MERAPEYSAPGMHDQQRPINGHSGQKRDYQGGYVSQQGQQQELYGGRSGDNFVKLFVGSVPRTIREDEVRPIFEEFGKVQEIALIKDKVTGLQRGCCFVKFETLDEAERAIKGLNNQRTLPGSSAPVQVRFADGERERLGMGVVSEYKLFVGSLGKSLTEKEIESIFTKFGPVDDVYIMRDAEKLSRGCAFVKFSSREVAQAAIDGLHGIYTVDGMDQPLAVRFADPKRQRPGETRIGGPGAGFQPAPQYSPRGGARPQQHMGGGQQGWRPMGGPGMGPAGAPPSSGPPQGGPRGQYGAPPMGGLSQGPPPMGGPGYSTPPQQQQQAPAYYQPPAQQQMYAPAQQQPPAQQQAPITAPQQSYYQSQGAPQQQQQQSAWQPGPTPPPVPAAAPPTCDWSEHTAPEGQKYYFNSVTQESRWTKPAELIALEANQQTPAQPLRQTTQQPYSSASQLQQTYGGPSAGPQQSNVQGGVSYSQQQSGVPQQQPQSTGATNWSWNTQGQ